MNSFCVFLRLQIFFPARKLLSQHFHALVVFNYCGYQFGIWFSYVILDVLRDLLIYFLKFCTIYTIFIFERSSLFQNNISFVPCFIFCYKVKFLLFLFSSLLKWWSFLYLQFYCWVLRFLDIDLEFFSIFSFSY